MVDWVSLTIAIVALIVSTALGVISLRISWKNLLTQFGPYLILKEKAPDSKEVEIENKGNGIAYNIEIIIIDDKGSSFQVFPYITYLAIDEIREIDFRIALENKYLKKEKKHSEELQNIKLVTIHCRDIHNSVKSFFYEYFEFADDIATQKYIPMNKKRIKQKLKKLRNK